jgi:uncharacterized repeat protein (TIGR03803 family)
MPQAPAHPGGTTSSKYKVVYNFGAVPDADKPRASLIDVGGVLYGTTKYGGEGSCANGYYGCGAVFSLTTDGTEKVLYSFSYGNDGLWPVASLLKINGRLYGTTTSGGPDGTVFSITTSGTVDVLHQFTGGTDGGGPAGDLIDVKGKLYGTTYWGGGVGHSGGRGTVFSITTSGVEKVLHSFGKSRQGANPTAGLIRVGGTLYGTTADGGAQRAGTVFRITTGGREKVLHSFGSGDGIRPVASLTVMNGTLYGTTQYGGTGACNDKFHTGCGTVFSITPSGTEQVLYSFAGGADGIYPVASLIDVNGSLYGTTEYGGTGACSSGYDHGCGTVFSITPSGTEQVLYSFGTAPDGANPVASLTDVNGLLYGTTNGGGAHGVGTVFALSP